MGIPFFAEVVLLVGVVSLLLLLVICRHVFFLLRPNSKFYLLSYFYTLALSYVLYMSLQHLVTIIGCLS